jgi:hypothetical protein
MRSSRPILDSACPARRTAQRTRPPDSVAALDMPRLLREPGGSSHLGAGTARGDQVSLATTGSWAPDESGKRAVGASLGYDVRGDEGLEEPLIQLPYRTMPLYRRHHTDEAARHPSSPPTSRRRRVDSRPARCARSFARSRLSQPECRPSLPPRMQRPVCPHPARVSLVGVFSTPAHAGRCLILSDPTGFSAGT